MFPLKKIRSFPLWSHDISTCSSLRWQPLPLATWNGCAMALRRRFHENPKIAGWFHGILPIKIANLWKSFEVGWFVYFMAMGFISWMVYFMEYPLINEKWWYHETMKNRWKNHGKAHFIKWKIDEKWGIPPILENLHICMWKKENYEVYHRVMLDSWRWRWRYHRVIWTV